MKSEKGMCSLHIVLHERTGVVSAAGSTFQLAPKNFSSYLELRNQSSMWVWGENSGCDGGYRCRRCSPQSL